MPARKTIALFIVILLVLFYPLNLSYASSIDIKEVAGRWSGKVDVKIISITTPSEKSRQEMIDGLKEIEAREQAFDLLAQPENKLLFNFTDYGNLLDYLPDGRISGQHHKTINTSDSTHNTDFDINGQVTRTSDGLTLRMDIVINSISKIDYGEGLKEITFNGIYTYTMNKIRENTHAVEKENEGNNKDISTDGTVIIWKETVESLKDINSNASSILPILSSVNAVNMTNLDRRAFQHFYKLHNGNMDEVKKELTKYMNARYTGTEVVKAEGKNPVYRTVRSLVSNVVGGAAGNVLSFAEGMLKIGLLTERLLTGTKPHEDETELPDIKGHAKRVADGVSEIVDIIAGKGQFVDKINAIKSILSTEKAKDMGGGGTRG